MFLEEFGNVWTKHVGELKSKSEKSVNVYARDITWLDNSDVLVAEITVPSIGVGMEIEHAIRMERKIPILCLFDMNSMKPLTRMVIDCPYVTTFGYPDIESAKTVISKNKALVELLSEALMKYETLTKEQIDFIVENKSIDLTLLNSNGDDLKSLRQKAKEKGIKGYTKMSKSELEESLKSEGE